MIFIAYNYEGIPISVVNAKSKELAYAYWHGAGIIPHSHKSLDDFTPLEEHPTGVIPLIHTIQMDGYNIQNRFKPEKKWIIITKN